VTVSLLAVFMVLWAVVFALVFVLGAIGGAVAAVAPGDWSDAEGLGLLAAVLWLRRRRDGER